MNRFGSPHPIPTPRRRLGGLAVLLLAAALPAVHGAESVVLPVVPVRVSMTVAGFEWAAAPGRSPAEYLTLPGSVMDNSAALSIRQEILLPGVVRRDANQVIVGLQWLLPQTLLSETTFQVLAVPEHPLALATLGVDERIGLLIADVAGTGGARPALAGITIRIPAEATADWKLVCVPAGRSFRLIPATARSGQSLVPLAPTSAPPILAPVFRASGEFDGFCYPFPAGGAAQGGWEWLPAQDIRSRADYIARHRVNLLSGYLGVFFGARAAGAPGDVPEVFIRSVVPASPAANAGLQPGDRLDRIGRQPVETVQQAVTSLRRFAPNSRVQIEVIREGQSLKRDVILGRRQVVAQREQERLLQALPEPRQRDLATLQTGAPDAAGSEAAAFPTMGIFLHPASRQLREMLGWQGDHGVLVSMALSGYPAAAAGLRAGDVILGIEGQPVTDVAAMPRILRTLQKGQPVTVRFFRDGEIRTVRVTLK